MQNHDKNQKKNWILKRVFPLSDCAYAPSFHASGWRYLLTLHLLCFCISFLFFCQRFPDFLFYPYDSLCCINPWPFPFGGNSAFRCFLSTLFLLSTFSFCIRLSVCLPHFTLFRCLSPVCLLIKLSCISFGFAWWCCLAENKDTWLSLPPYRSPTLSRKHIHTQIYRLLLSHTLFIMSE